MKLSLSTASLYVYPLKVVFAMAKRAGFDGIELAINPEVDLRGAEYARRLSEEYGLPIYSVHPPMFPYPGWRYVDRNVTVHLPRALQVAQEVQASILVVHLPAAHSEREENGREFLRNMARARERMNGHGPRLAVENRAKFVTRDGSLILAQPDDLRAYADDFDLPMTLDTAHLGTWDLGLRETLPYFAGRLANVHLSDLRDVSPRVESTPMLHSYVKQHQLPGMGKLPLAEFLRVLARQGFPGPITYELSPLSLKFWNPQAVEKNLRECVSFVRRATENARPPARLDRWNRPQFAINP